MIPSRAACWILWFPDTGILWFNCLVETYNLFFLAFSRCILPELSRVWKIWLNENQATQALKTQCLIVFFVSMLKHLERTQIGYVAENKLARPL